jgi:hypothetical protein
MPARTSALLAIVVLTLGPVLGLGGCRAADPVPEPEETAGNPPVRKAPLFDPSREPAAAVLALVPADAEVLTVTDFDEVRVQLGVPDLTSEDPVSDSLAFWERARGEAPLLTDGMLREHNSELLLDYGFTQDDVDWEAHFTGPGGNGYVLSFRPDVDFAAVSRAVSDGVGPLGGAQVMAERHLVVSGIAAQGEGVWATDPTWNGLVGEPAEATYLRRGCIPLDEALGPHADAEDQEQLLAAHPVTNLDELAGFSVAFGDHNATVRMSINRDDLFHRIDLGRDWPVESFGQGFRTGVGDPRSGRIGYDVPRPPLAASLALLEELPFAVCPEVEPIPEPTG